MRVLCVGRHTFLSEHLCRFFDELGVDTVPCVGMSDAMSRVRSEQLDAVICDYDLLATMSLTEWEADPVVARVPLIAVSLTRHPGEAHLMDINGIAGFFYLPTLEPGDAKRVLAGISRNRVGVAPPPMTGGLSTSSPNGQPWPGTTPVAQLR
jgi:hypothetical protein